MSYISEEELKGKGALNLAPMIDFLFLMLMFFACLAVSRASTKDTDIELVEAKSSTAASMVEGESLYKIINISITAAGEYRWVTEVRDYVMNDADEIAQELVNQYQKGLLPEDKQNTQVMLKIDKAAAWAPILKVILAIKEAGFEARPVFQPEAAEA